MESGIHIGLRYQVLRVRLSLGTLTPEERRKRLKEIDNNTVVDFGTAVAELRKALHSK